MKKLSIIAATVAITLVACQKNEAPVVKTDGDFVRFSTNISSYTVKSTDTSLEENDAVGIFAGAPIGSSNIQYTVNNQGKLSSTIPIKWVAGSTAPVDFTAYYPYDSEVQSTEFDFAVELDQNVAGKFAASDLMSANVADATPGEDVALHFYHKLHKIILNVTNNSGKTIAGVVINDVVPDATVNVETGVITPKTDKTSIRPVDKTGGKYEAIIIPQTAKPTIVITATDGTRYTFVISADTEFVSGKTATAALTLPETEPEEGEAVEFSFTVEAWGENSNLSVDNPVVVKQKVWNVIGTLNGDNWTTDIPMTLTTPGANEGEGVWEVDITYAEGDVFKLRLGSDWANPNAGMKTGWEVFGTGIFPSGDNYLEASSDNNIKLPAAGQYHLSFTYPSHYFVVTETN